MYPCLGGTCPKSTWVPLTVIYDIWLLASKLGLWLFSVWKQILTRTKLEIEWKTEEENLDAKRHQRRTQADSLKCPGGGSSLKDHENPRALWGQTKGCAWTFAPISPSGIKTFKHFKSCHCILTGRIQRRVGVWKIPFQESMAKRQETWYVFGAIYSRFSQPQDYKAAQVSASYSHRVSSAVRWLEHPEDLDI